MSDSIQIDRWSRPWSPTPDAELVETLNHYDMPLLGVIKQHGAHYLFRCIAGQVESTHIWAYRLLSESERQELDRVDSPEALREIVAQLYSHGPLTLAVASDDAGIFGSTEVSTLAPEDLEHGLRTLIDEARGYLKEQAALLEASTDLLASASTP